MTLFETLVKTAMHAVGTRRISAESRPSECDAGLLRDDLEDLFQADLSCMKPLNAIVVPKAVVQMRPIRASDLFEMRLAA